MLHKIKIIAAACFVAGTLNVAPAWANEFTNWMPTDRQGDGTGGGQAVGGDVPGGDVRPAPPGSSGDSNTVYKPIARVKPKAGEKKYSPIGGPFAGDGKPIRKPPVNNNPDKYSPIGGPFAGDGTANGGSGSGQYSPIGRPPASVGGGQYSPIGFHPTGPANKCTRAIPRMCNDSSVAVTDSGTCKQICPEDK